MKALVLSGGSGTRLRPFSYSMPKQLIPVANRPVLEYVLDNARTAGATDIGVIVGDGAAQIRDALGDGSHLGVRITYIAQSRPLGLAHCVRLAQDFLGDDDFAMLLGDNILPGGVADIAGEFTARRPAAQVVVHKVADPSAFGVAELDENGRVLRLAEKPARPRSDLALIGVYFFTPAIHEAVRAIAPSARGELEITDAIQWLVGHGAEVRASEHSGYWRDTGRVEDVLDCNRKLLEGVRYSVQGEVDEHSVLAGPVVIERGVRVVRSHVQGPAVIGAGSLLDHSSVGPNSSIGRDCVLRDTHLADSIALDGASVTGVRGVHGSLIGRHARVGPGKGGTAHHTLVVGDHSTVEVAV
ncbi:glucose-1-phosphate thymidylyltransferase [Actinacidiphila bryophytorum]|uniref:glucose-1-phosphate thymidylyltransferase n=1 Tax=Actinacidiphila bryophytorum TaxID=1436133 RepID=UPI002176C965|nr:glucose-1-phosphate thymidylyltransferase [Actinacidiphila bryophytorum]UWE10064.1 glucose-1-phosphate thymidylyltransferase [Actinacidiphila bryophytorum]